MNRKVFLGMLSMIVFLGAQAGFAATVNLAWDPNTESDLDGYRVHYGTTSRSEGVYGNVAQVDDEGVSSVQIDLPEDGTYYFSLTAFDSAGNESGFSNEVSAVISGSVALGKPGQPILIQ